MAEWDRYLCVARLDGIDRVFFWESDNEGHDRIVLDDEGFVRAFPSETMARQASRASSEEPSMYDLDSVAAWCRSSGDVVDCRALLNAWNLFGDLPRGENLFAAADVRANQLYEKLFMSCNLPSITPPGEEYVPDWSAVEIANLKRLLLLGLAELRARLR